MAVDLDKLFNTFFLFQKLTECNFITESRNFMIRIAFVLKSFFPIHDWLHTSHGNGSKLAPAARRRILANCLVWLLLDKALASRAVIVIIHWSNERMDGWADYFRNQLNNNNNKTVGEAIYVNGELKDNRRFLVP